MMRSATGHRSEARGEHEASMAGTAGEFVYAKFGHSAASLSNPVSPAEDKRDNVLVFKHTLSYGATPASP